MSEFGTVTVARTARKLRYCSSCGYHSIRPGERYLEHTLLPSHDLSGGTFQRTGECAKHAAMFGRDTVLEATGGAVPEAEDGAR